MFATVLGAALAATLVNAQANANCGAKSFALPSWLVQDFKGPAAAATSGNSTFTLTNRATNASVGVECASTADSGGWRRCASGESIEASLQYNGTSAWLRIGETWSCSDPK